MKIAIRSKSTLILAAMVAISAACSHSPSVQEYPDTASATEEVSKFNADMKSAHSKQIDILSPVAFSEATEALNDAKESLNDQEEARNTLRHVARGRAYLNRSNEFARLSHANIEEVIAARRQAIAARAPEFVTAGFNEADEAFRDVTSDIEKNKLDGAIEKRSSLQQMYLGLELQAIKQARLGASREMIAKAKDEGAEDFAPSSLALAEKSVLDTDAFITGNRHDTAQLAARSEATFKTAQHLVKITRKSKSGDKTSSEDRALKLETVTNNVATKQGQINAKNQQLADSQAQLADKDGQLANNEEALMSMSDENHSLESEQAFNRRFEQAQAEFTNTEAEVYKQGNTFMIRLKSLEFPVSQAVLKGSNFPLLVKVQTVIKSFGKSVVIVEGHTDSNGGKTLNEKLSSDRAEAVRQYLLSNSEDKTTEIKAIGYDYQKPLSTNKTASGRAQNRRVDVLIQPIQRIDS